MWQVPDTTRKVLYRGAGCKVPLADAKRLAGSGVTQQSDYAVFAPKLVR